MEPFSFGLFPFVTIWWLTVLPSSSSQYQDMVCENLRTGRDGRKMTEPGPECDLSDRNWCSIKTSNYPEDKIMEIILDNRGIMKRLFGDNREARFLENSFSNQVDGAPSRPPPRYRPKKKSSTTADNLVHGKVPENSEDNVNVKFPDSNGAPTEKLSPALDEFQNGKFPDSDILASVRHGKKIDDDDPREMKVITVEAFLDEQKDNKDSDSYDYKLSKTKTFEAAPPRSNDKVYSKTFDLPVRNTMTMTMTTPMTDIDDLETTEATIFEDTTNNEDMSTIELGEIFDEVTSITESPEVLEAVKSLEVTTEITTETLKKDDTLESRTEPPIVENNKIVIATTEIPLDSGDDLRYTQPKPSASSPTEEPSTASNSFRSGLPPRSRPRPELWRKPPPKEALEARVETPNRFSQGQNNQGSRYNNPTSSVAQSFLRQPSQPSKRDPIIEKPSLLLEENPSQGGPYHMEKFPACNSTSEIIAPTWAKSIQGKNLIVVNVGSFMQHLHVEECDKASLYRKMYCQRGCRCEQQYRLQKLLVIDPDDECRGIFSDWFRFPSCCVCVCYPSSMSRGGRSFNSDFDEEEYWEDDDYFDDPFVSHYFGLDDGDFEDNFANDEDVNSEVRASSRTFIDDLQPSASSQTYTSFTDIDSIDRSFSRELPEKFQEENRRLSSRDGNLLGSISINNTLNYVEATKEKKSRLLAGFPSNRTVNIRPQMAPRRTPPTRIAIPPYAFSWGQKSSSANLWPALSSYNQLPQNYISNPSPNQYSLSNFADTVLGAIPSPPVARDVATLGTLNAATQPYYKWNRRPRTLEGFEAVADSAENQPSFSRIPR